MYLLIVVLGLMPLYGPEQASPVIQQPRFAKESNANKTGGQEEADKEQEHVSTCSQISTLNEGVWSPDVNSPTKQEEQTDSYDPRGDGLYRWYLRLSLISSIAAAIGVAFLIASVSAARQGAKALMDAEGGFLSVDPSEFTLTDDERKTAITFRIHNPGRTAAFSYAAEHLMQVGDSPDIPPMPMMFEASDESSGTPDFLIPADKDAPHTGAQKGVGCQTFLSTHTEPMMGKGDRTKPYHFIRLTDGERAEMVKGTKFVWCYGFVRYRDIFKRRFELRFCHRYEPRLERNGGFLVAGPQEFNRLTRRKPPIAGWRKAVNWWETQIENMQNGESG